MIQHLLLMESGDGTAVKVLVHQKDERSISRWNDLLMSPTWNVAWLAQRSTRVPENPLGILFAVHIGVSRGPLTLWSLCA